MVLDGLTSPLTSRIRDGLNEALLFAEYLNLLFRNALQLILRDQ